MNIHLHGIVLADAPDLIKTRFGIPSFEDLHVSLVESGVNPDLARALAKLSFSIGLASLKPALI